ncbi:MAG: glycosyltransferase [Flavobacteriaceae bacterium]
MKTCIVIPLYNEYQRFDQNSFLSFVKNNDLIFCLVNDGSNDQTMQMIESLAKGSQKIYSLNLEKNLGKAEAVRAGTNYAISNLNCKIIGYFDADFATPLQEILNLEKLIQNSLYALVMGSRVKRLGANIKRFKIRHFSGRIIATIISENILGLPVYDTQCGLKLMTKEIAEIVFKDKFISKWLFDVEIIARIKNKFGKDYCIENIYEFPLSKWEDKGKSKITFIDALTVPINLTKLFFYYK